MTPSPDTRSVYLVKTIFKFLCLFSELKKLESLKICYVASNYLYNLVLEPMLYLCNSYVFL